MAFLYSGFRTSAFKVAVGVEALAILVCCFSFASPALGQYTPDHPAVVKMVDSGISFIRSKTSNSQYGMSPVGQSMMAGYTILKATGEDADPLVKSAVSDAVKLLVSLDPDKFDQAQFRFETKIIYEASLAAIVVATADADRYRRELDLYLKWLDRVQKNHGGFGYLNRPTGDTSQVQYVALALWTIKHSGLNIPVKLTERLITYIGGTMDPRGGWGYQAVYSSGQPVAQTEVTRTLSTAGAGALIVCGDTLGFFSEVRKRKRDPNAIVDPDRVPDAFHLVGDRESGVKVEVRSSMNAASIADQIQRSQQFIAEAKDSSREWYFYWRYSQERYESFLEIANGQQEDSPPWYNEGVIELIKMQGPEGGWGQASGTTNDIIDTSFAVLFLIRSTQKSIGKIGEGVAFGGNSLPTDVSNVKMVGEKLVNEAELTVENLLSVMESEGNDINAGMLPENLQLSKDPKQKREQVARFSRLLTSDDPLARRLAAKLLGRSEDINIAPDLIYALSDPDPYVPSVAEEGLRLLSRKLTAGKLGVSPTETERATAEDYWKKWYLGLRPDYVFLQR